jgi:hypothetical protein
MLDFLKCLWHNEHMDGGSLLAYLELLNDYAAAKVRIRDLEARAAEMKPTMWGTDSLLQRYDEVRALNHDLKKRVTLLEKANAAANAIIGADADARLKSETELRKRVFELECKLTDYENIVEMKRQAEKLWMGRWRAASGEYRRQPCREELLMFTWMCSDADRRSPDRDNRDSRDRAILSSILRAAGGTGI